MVARAVWSHVTDTNLIMAWQTEEFTEKHRGGVSWVEMMGRKCPTSAAPELLP